MLDDDVGQPLALSEFAWYMSLALAALPASGWIELHPFHRHHRHRRSERVFCKSRVAPHFLPSSAFFFLIYVLLVFLYRRSDERFVTWVEGG